MKENLLTWNFANLVTVGLMVAGLYFTAVTVTKVAQARKGA